MDSGILRHVLGMPKPKKSAKPKKKPFQPLPGIPEEMLPVNSEEYKKIVKSFEGQDEPDEPGPENEELDEEEYRKRIVTHFLKLFRSPGWMKGYVSNVQKAMNITSDYKAETALIKNELGHLVSSLVDRAASTYKIKQTELR